MEETKNIMYKAVRKARELVYNAQGDDRKIKDIELGQALVRVISGDEEWVMEGSHQERRMYHLLYMLSDMEENQTL